MVFLVSYFSFFSSTALAAEPTTTIVVEDAKEGENGWYWEPPTVTFSCSHPSAKVYYYFNGFKGGALLYDGEPIDILGWYSKERLSPGKFIVRISYYSVLGETKEEVQSFDLKVNTVQPEIVLDKPSETDFKTTAATLEILGRVVSIFMIDKGEERLPCEASISINNEEIPVNDETCYFRNDVPLQLGENTINITAKDASGRTKEILLHVYRYQDPAEGDQIEHYSVLINLNEAEIWMNDNELPRYYYQLLFGRLMMPQKFFKENFPFQIDEEYSPTNMTLTLSHQDTEILFFIRDTRVMVNGIEKVMDCAPDFNHVGSWILPFRFIFETLGGEVGWNAETREITVEIDL
jgi:hypothetical protein